jgi:beta-glucosidase
VTRPFQRLIALGSILLAASLAPLTVPTQATSAPTNPTACPIAHLPTSPSDAPWESPSYQGQFTPAELAKQVVACEVQFHPTSALIAEVSLIGLHNTSNKEYQNQNMWLGNASGPLTPQHDFLDLGIPPVTLEDGPDGLVYRAPTGQIQPTSFPNEMALASSMDPSLAEAYGDELGAESAELHYTGVQAPDLDLDRIPNWGRISETFGESPVLAGEIGGAEAIGILQHSPMVILKHFGIYGQETSRRSINWTVSTAALYDTYLRPFEIATTAVAHSPAVSSDRQVGLMCSYGDINGQRSCASQTMTRAASTLPFSGLVRSDLNTVTTAPALLRAGVSLIKPLDESEFEPTSSVSAPVRALITNAAETVIATLFAAKLVDVTELAASKGVGTLTSAVASPAQMEAETIEERGAVLLQDGASGAPGSLPIAAHSGTLAIVAPYELASTCAALQARLAKALGITVTCTAWNHPPDPATVLLARLARSYGKKLSTTVEWTPTKSGAYVVDNWTYGDSQVDLDGVMLQRQPGLGELYGSNDTTIEAVAGHHYTFTEFWQAIGPHLTITALSSHIQGAINAIRASHASSVLVLADDSSSEGADLDELNLPEGQDALIQAVGAVAPTSVALFTTGPVVMPWLSSVDSVIELWNPGGLPPYGTMFTSLVPAYAALLTGAVSPTGRLPITFPKSQGQSPMGTVPGSTPSTYWPGVDGTADLDVSPNDGVTIGYDWYVQEHWKVLFPFGYGRSYATSATTTFAPGSRCATANSATSLCLPVAVSLSGATNGVATSVVQIYAEAPASDPSGGLPALVAASAVTCKPSSGSTCAPANAEEVVTALDLGGWNGSTYAVTAGCYTFVVASNAATADSEIAHPSSYPGEVVNATAPFSHSSVLHPGACAGAP